MTGRPQWQRVAAYAVILRGEQILLTRLATRVTSEELWTLPGGGLDHGEDPRAAVVREVHEETGLDVRIGEDARVYSYLQRGAWRHGHKVDAHALRIVYDGWVAHDAPAPHVVEVDGSTAEAAWQPLAAVLDGSLPTVSLVGEAVAGHAVAQVQRVAAYALVTRSEPEPAVLLTRISERGFHSGSWTLPGGGVDQGESPRAALVREVQEECGVDCVVGEVLEVDDVSVRGTAPSGRDEDFHGVHLVFEATIAGDVTPQVVEVGGTTDAVAWVPLASVQDETVPVLPVVRAALAAEVRRRR